MLPVGLVVSEPSAGDCYDGADPLMPKGVCASATAKGRSKFPSFPSGSSSVWADMSSAFFPAGVVIGFAVWLVPLAWRNKGELAGRLAGLQRQLLAFLGLRRRRPGRFARPGG